MKRWLKQISQRVYFIPAVFSVFGLVLAVVLAYLEIGHIDRIQVLPEILLTNRETARNLFSSLVGALLTMITVSFSTIMVVLTLYSAQFTPRITRDFLERKVPLLVLGIFMASFIFSIISLYSLDKMAAEQLLLSPFVGVVLAILCLAFFGFFIHHVARSVQINYIIDRLTREIMASVDKNIEEIERNGDIQRRLQKWPDDLPKEPNLEIPAGNWGFIKAIDYRQLVKVAHEHGLMLRLQARLGDFLEVEDAFVSVFAYQDAAFDEAELAEAVQETLTSGEERDAEKDVEFGITKLVEVALRAISPGFNDPNTAIYCISKLGPILRTIGRDLEHRYYFDDEDVLRLHAQNLLFRELLYQTVFQLRTHGKHDVSILGALLECLGTIAVSDHEVEPEDLWAVAGYLVEKLPLEEMPRMDVVYLNERIRDLARHVPMEADELLLQPIDS